MKSELRELNKSVWYIEHFTVVDLSRVARYSSHSCKDDMQCFPYGLKVELLLATGYTQRVRPKLTSRKSETLEDINTQLGLLRPDTPLGEG